MLAIRSHTSSPFEYSRSFRGSRVDSRGGTLSLIPPLPPFSEEDKRDEDPEEAGGREY